MTKAKERLGNGSLEDSQKKNEIVPVKKGGDLSALPVSGTEDDQAIILVKKKGEPEVVYRAQDVEFVRQRLSITRLNPVSEEGSDDETSEPGGGDGGGSTGG